MRASVFAVHDELLGERRDFVGELFLARRVRLMKKKSGKRCTANVAAIRAFSLLIRI